MMQWFGSAVLDIASTSRQAALATSRQAAPATFRQPATATSRRAERAGERAIAQPLSYMTLPIDGLMGYRETKRIYKEDIRLHAAVCFILHVFYSTISNGPRYQTT